MATIESFLGECGHVLRAVPGPVAKLRCVQPLCSEFYAVVYAPRPVPALYVVPVDPADATDTECCQ